MRTAWLFPVVLVVCGCTTYRDDLNRGQRYYEKNEFERSLAIWRVLEQDFDSLSHKDQARYAYLRGMTDYRLGGGPGGKDPQFRAHARHWLALAKVLDQAHPGGLSAEWKERMEQALEELNREVYGLSPAEAAESTVSSAPEQVLAPLGATITEDGGLPRATEDAGPREVTSDGGTGSGDSGG